jgi:hypothetical protein
MACGIAGEELMLRLGEDGADAALDERHVRPMDFTGKPMRSMVLSSPRASRRSARLVSGFSVRWQLRSHFRPSGGDRRFRCHTGAPVGL